MFYCKQCGTDNGWPTGFHLPMSRGPCEMCKTMASCFDVPSSSLPREKENRPLTMETTFALIKPDAVRYGHVSSILSMMEKKFLVADVLCATWPKSLAMQFYADLQEKSFFPDLVKFMSSDRLYMIMLVSPDAVSRWRAMMGATDPMKAAPDTVRGLYSAKDGVIMHNVVHGSDSAENVQRERELIASHYFGQPDQEHLFGDEADSFIKKHRALTAQAGERT